MIALSAGHLAVDFASGSVPALIPFLTDRFHLNYAFAAVLLLAATISSSLVQPLFGLWSRPAPAPVADPRRHGACRSRCRRGRGPPVYPLVVLFVFAGGLGVAAFHPRREVRRLCQRRRRASGMSYFNIGGNLGYALGAFVTGLLVVRIGLVGGLLAMIPVLVGAAALLRLLRGLPGSSPRRTPDAHRGEDQRAAMASSAA